MAANKKSVILYCDIIHTIEQLDDIDAGLLFKHFLRYVNDLNPEPPNKMVQIVFEPIKQQLKRDLKHWESVKEGRSKAGKASAIKRQQMSTNVDKRQQSSTNSTVNDNVTVNVNVNDNVINNKFNAIAFMCSLGYDENLTKEWFKVRKSKKLTNTEIAMAGFNSEVVKTGKPINEILKTCIERSWGGFKSDWIINKTEQTVKRKQFKLD